MIDDRLIILVLYFTQYVYLVSDQTLNFGDAEGKPEPSSSGVIT